MVSRTNVRESERVRLLSVPFRFRRARPRDDLGAVERTRTVASGEAAGNGFVQTGPGTVRALIWQRERRKASKEKCRREKEGQARSSNIDKRARVRGRTFFRISIPRAWSYVLAVSSSSSSSSPVADSFGTCSLANVTLGCLVDGVFCAVERHNDTGQKLSMLRVCGVSASTYALGVSKVYNALLDTFSYAP